MKIQTSKRLFLVVNAGSSSLKFQLFAKLTKAQQQQYKLLVRGLFERIGDPEQSQFIFQLAGQPKEVKPLQMKTHKVAVTHLILFLKKWQLVKNLDNLVGIGHRVVNCGPQLTQSCLINRSVLVKMKQNLDFAPLHNPAMLQTVETFAQQTTAPAVAVFDTFFHHTIPQLNYLYPIPYDWYLKHNVRRYGMHGTNYRYVLQQLTKLVQKPAAQINTIVCHLGNGASLCAIKNGQSVITSMGLTPLEGLMMGTRSGDLDPAIGQYLKSKINLDLNQFIDTLNFKSGLLAVSGISSDMRTIKTHADQGNQRCQLAIKMFVSRVCKYISWYQNEVGSRLDAIVFTGGIGENSTYIRQAITDKLITLKLILDSKVNTTPINNDHDQLISSPASEVPVYVIPANEELIMCQDIDRICQQ